MSNKRITIVLNEKIEKQVRRLQAHLILEDNESHSFSQVINDVLRKGLK